MVGYGETSPPEPTGITAALTASCYTTPVLPDAACRFDATSTSDDSRTREFHSLRYVWDFDDAGQGAWSYGARADAGDAIDRNTGAHPIYAHTFPAATGGTYSVGLTASNSSGDSDSTSVNVTVEDEDDYFDGTGGRTTFCISDTASIGSGCPAGATEVTSVTDAFTAIETSCNADANHVRCLFRRGGTWTESATPNLATSGSYAGILGAYGSGDKPQITGPASTPVMTLGSEWVIRDLALVVNASCTIGNDCAVFNTDGATTRNTINRVDASNMSDQFVINGSSAIGDDLAIVDSTMTLRSSIGASTGALVYGEDPGVIFLGNEFDHNGNEGSTLRVTAANGSPAGQSVVAHNWVHDKPSGFAHFRLRGDHQGGWVFWDNRLGDNTDTGTSELFRVCAEANCGGSGGNGGGDLLIDSNFIYYEGTSGLSRRPLEIAWGNTTIRNNFLEYQGSGTNSASWIQKRDNQLGSNDNFHILNNTFFNPDDTGSSMVFAQLLSGGGSGHLIKGNLFRGGAGFSPTIDSGFGSNVANEVSGDDPFAAAMPAQGFTDILDAEINSTQAATTGPDYSAATDHAVIIDAAGDLHSDQSDIDIGAHGF